MKTSFDAKWDTHACLCVCVPGPGRFTSMRALHVGNLQNDTDTIPTAAAQRRPAARFPIIRVFRGPLPAAEIRAGARLRAHFVDVPQCVCVCVCVCVNVCFTRAPLPAPPPQSPSGHECIVYTDRTAVYGPMCPCMQIYAYHVRVKCGIQGRPPESPSPLPSTLSACFEHIRMCASERASEANLQNFA